MSEALIDVKRSERLGEQIPVAKERLRMHREGLEHIDVNGHLKVPVASWDRAPVREGWKAYWVSFVSFGLDSPSQKWFTYRRAVA